MRGGAGGSIAWAELDTGLSVAICHNAMHSGAWPDVESHPYKPIVDAARTVAVTDVETGAADAGSRLATAIASARNIAPLDGSDPSQV